MSDRTAPAIRIHTDPQLWQPADDSDGTILSYRGDLTVGGVPFHLHAWRADTEPALDADVIAEAVVADQPFQTVRIGGADYIVLATPHS